MNETRTASAERIGNRTGFTLAELLVVIIIIALLAALSLTVQRTAVQSARRERTNATIRKIDAALTAAYEKYQYRKPDLGSYIENFERIVDNQYPNASDVDKKREVNRRILLFLVKNWNPWLDKDFADTDLSVDVQIAPYITRTILLRELLLCDFPDTYDEAVYEPFLSDSPVHLSYLRELEKAIQKKTSEGDPNAEEHLRTDENLSADLLYLIVMNASPETRGTFLEREIADTNDNGIPEFVDGWGNPIRFLRWAPALEKTNRQPTYTEALLLQQYRLVKQTDDAGDELSTGDGSFYNTDVFYSESYGGYPLSSYDFYTNFDVYYPGLLESSADPFDPMESLSGWLLTPFIYSAGPDGDFGMESSYEAKSDRNGLLILRNPFLDGLDRNIGIDDSDEAADNITNHNME